MNSTQPIYFPQFIPPQSESLLSSKTIVFFVLNLFTLGFYGAAETVIKQHRIKKLEADGQELHQKVHQLSNNWSKLEKHLSKLIDQFKELDREDDEEFQDLKSKITRLSNENRVWKQQDIQSNIDFKNGLTEFALNTIAFIGHLIANILTVGLYGVYQNYQLKNRVKVLKAEHQHVEQGIKNIQKTIAEKVDTHLKLVKKGAELAKDLDVIAKTPADVSRQQVVQANQQQALLEKDCKDLKATIDAIQIRVTAAKALKDTNEAKLAKEKEDYNKLRWENAALIKEKNELEYEKQRYQRDENTNKNVVPDLRAQLDAINEKAGRVKELQQEVQQLQQAVEVPPNFDQLKKLVGPIPPLYAQRPEDQEIEGALDYKQDPDRLDALDDAEAAEIKAYNERYDGKVSAPAVLEAGFKFAFKALMDMKEQGKAAGDQKINLVNTLATIGTPGEFSIYRYMVWDWLKRGKLHRSAEGYELKINEHVSMLPSESKRVLRYKTELDGTRKPVVEVHYTRQDGFTPPFDELRKQNGVDAVRAKWVIEQLSAEEQEHLFNLLMAPVIEDEHPDFIQTKEYMRDSANPRVQLVLKAFEYISGIGEVIRGKFGQSVLPECWSEVVEESAEAEDEPFKKASDAPPVIIEEVAVDKRVVKWEFDEDVIGDKRAGDVAPRQSDFAQLIKKTKEELQTIFKYLDKTYVDATGKEQPLDLLAYREKEEKIVNPAWEPHVNRQYHSSHHTFGYGAYSGHWCLFSNLTAVLINDYNNVTDANVWAVKRSMATYIDKLLVAEKNFNAEFIKNNIPLLSETKKWELVKKEMLKEALTKNGISIPASENKDKWKAAKQELVDKGVPLPENIDSWELAKKEFIKKGAPLPEDAEKLKELAVLAKDFRASIDSAYKPNGNRLPGWTLEQYQLWLRNEEGAPKWGNRSWTPTDLSIAAHAFGVRICLISIAAGNLAGVTVDKYGRLSGEYYGPNTEEVLYMGAIPGSFYGLFPKLNLKVGNLWGGNEKENAELKAHIDPEDWKIMEKYQNWWKQHATPKN